MELKKVTENYVPLLAKMNYQLITDEGHNNSMNSLELEERIYGW